MMKVCEQTYNGAPVLNSKDDKATNGGTNDGNHDITVELLLRVHRELLLLRRLLIFEFCFFLPLILYMLFKLA